MNQRLPSVELLQGIDQRELDDRQQAAHQDVRIEQQEIDYATFSHRERVGISRAPVVAMMLQMIFSEGDERDDDWNRREDAERPVLPLDSVVELQALRLII